MMYRRGDEYFGLDAYWTSKSVIISSHIQVILQMTILLLNDPGRLSAYYCTSAILPPTQHQQSPVVTGPEIPRIAQSMETQYGLPDSPSDPPRVIRNLSFPPRLLSLEDIARTSSRRPLWDTSMPIV